MDSHYSVLNNIVFGGRKNVSDESKRNHGSDPTQPMLLIDTIEELTPGEHGIGKKCVSYNEPYFAGHFPQEPVMPGVLMIEALAQVGAVVMLSCPEYKGKTAYFGAINQAKFKRKVVPGDVLMLEVEMIKKKGPIGIGKAVATVEGEVAVSAELTFAIG